MLQELCVVVKLGALTDSSASKVFVLRRGRGRVKHLTKQFVVQELCRTGCVVVSKVPWSFHPAELLTHQCGRRQFQCHLEGLRLLVGLKW